MTINQQISSKVITRLLDYIKGKIPHRLYLVINFLQPNIPMLNRKIALTSQLNKLSYSQSLMSQTSHNLMLE